ASNVASAVLPASAPSLLAVTLSPSTVQPLVASGSTNGSDNVSLTNIVLTEQNKNQKNVAPSAVALNHNGGRNHGKSASNHHSPA
ncbi:MAG TPA: hypothetical protein VGG44_02160, partial [Tepidisphaeraceae bacterium]